MLSIFLLPRHGGGRTASPAQPGPACRGQQRDVPGRKLQRKLLFGDRVYHPGQGIPVSLATPQLLFLEKMQSQMSRAWKKQEEEVQSEIHSVFPGSGPWPSALW